RTGKSGGWRRRWSARPRSWIRSVRRYNRRGSRRVLLDAAIQELRRLQPGLIRIVGEDHAAAAHGVDDLLRNRLANRGASPAAAKPPVRPGDAGIDVGRAVHHDGALAGVGVEAGLQSIEPQRVAVVADVGVGGAEQADARLEAFRLVRETGRHVVAAVAAVRHEL